MPRSNVTAKQKLDAVKKILSGEESRRHIRQIYGVAHSSVEEWILKYQIKGEKAFSDKFQKVEYSKEVKEAAVKAYLNGDGSQNEICRIYGLNSRSPLEQWIKEYNSNKELKSSKSHIVLYLSESSFSLYTSIFSKFNPYIRSYSI